MVAMAERRYTHRPETIREANLRMELNVLRAEVEADCDEVINRLDRLVPAAVEIGPAALQLLIGATRKVESMRLRVTG